MVLALSNEHIVDLLSAQDCLDAVREAYRELGSGRAVNRPRTDMWMPANSSHSMNDYGAGRTATAYYVLKSFEGAVESLGTAALRLNSDIIEWQPTSNGLRKDKQPLAPGGRYNGLVLVFEIATGALIGIMPDGYLQMMRVGATTAIAAELMSRSDADTLGVLGSGPQAEAAIRCLVDVRPLKRITVFSPSRPKLENFCSAMEEMTGVEVRPSRTAEGAVRGHAIVSTNTNVVGGVLEAEWLEEGSHVSCVKYLELPPKVITQSDIVVINTSKNDPMNYFPGSEEAIIATDPVDVGSTGSGKERARPYLEAGIRLDELPLLHELFDRKAPLRSDTAERSCFLNAIGQGIQFVAVATAALRRARAAGIGVELPDDLFTQTYHP